MGGDAARSQVLMYQLCKGVAFVHGRGVLHRDLKPHNLLMERTTMVPSLNLVVFTVFTLCTRMI